MTTTPEALAHLRALPESERNAAISELLAGVHGEPECTHLLVVDRTGCQVASSSLAIDAHLRAHPHKCTGLHTREALAQVAAEAVRVERERIADLIGVAIEDGPEYHAQGMGCGIEDQGITDRYEAAEYGWNEAEGAWCAEFRGVAEALRARDK